MPRRLLSYKTPTQITGLVAWLRADDIAGVDGDAVASWTDGSGSANTPVQATPAAQPTYKTNVINGHSAVRFDGGDRLAMPTESNFDLTTPTIFVVFKRTSGTSGTILGKATTSTTGAGRRKMQVSLTNTGINYTSGGDTAAVGVSADLTGWNLFGVATVSDSNHTLYDNGTQSTNLNALSDTTTNNATMEIGANFGNGAEAFIGDIAEIIIYNVPIAGSEVVGLQNYLATRYALTVVDALGGSPRVAASGRTHIASVPGVRLNGTSDYIDIGTLGSFGTSINNDGLVSFAFRVRTDSTTQSSIIGTSNGGINTTLAVLINRDSTGSASANKMGIFFRNDNNVYQNVGTTNTIGIADGLSHQYVVKRVSRYVWEIWKDGVSMTMSNPSASGDLTAGFTNFTYPVTIGASGGSSVANFAAIDISEVLIYQRALTSTEIGTLYAGTTPTGAFRQFSLTQGGSIAIDSSTNAINGVIHGGLTLSARVLVGEGVAS